MHACHTRVTLHSFLTKSASWLPREEGGTGLRVELELQLVWGRVRAKKSDGDSGATMPSRNNQTSSVLRPKGQQHLPCLKLKTTNLSN